jgi:mono/diheme cytochrome c family protein
VAADAPGRADIAQGEHIARIVCSACHVVASDQEFPPILNQPTPDFSEIANRPGTTAATLQHFVLNTHWDVNKLPMTMPNPMLTQDQAREVARYIISLRKH